MEYRTLGKTGLEVSCLSFGASSLGSVFRRISKSEGVRAVHAALDGGINFIDVSPYYGLTAAETVLGEALSEIPRDRYLLATKVGRYGDTDFDFSPERVRSSVDESLKRLGCEYIDIIQCHDVEFGDLEFVVGETIPALRQLQKCGKVRFVGVTGLPLSIFEYVMDRTEIDTALSYCHYSLNDTSLLQLLPYLIEKEVGIISASVFSMGLLTRRGAPPWHPAPARIRDGCQKAVRFCQAKGADIEKLAFQFSLSNPDVHTTLVGTADPEHVVRNLRWLNEPMDGDLLQEVQTILEPVRDRTWLVGSRKNTRSLRSYRVRLCEEDV